MQSEEKVIFESLLKAQAEFPVMPKDSSAGGRYRYTSLDVVVSIIRPILAKYGLGFVQLLSSKDGRDTLITRLISADGSSIESESFLPSLDGAKMNSVQAIGATITYMKRYALTSMLGLVADEDVDANVDTIPMAPSKKTTSAPKAFAPEKAVQEVMSGTFIPTKAQFDELVSIMKAEKDGKPLFTNEQKDKYKKLMKAPGEWLKDPVTLIEEAKADLELAKVPF